MPRKRPPLGGYSDEEIFAEAARRMRARQTDPPHPKVLRPCPRCEQMFGARELRLHKPLCTGPASSKPASKPRV